MTHQFITWTEIQQIKIKHKKKLVLKPCPFCGSKAEFRVAGWNKAYGLRCTGCKIITPVRGGMDGQLRAAEFWNTRVEES